LTTYVYNLIRIYKMDIGTIIVLIMFALVWLWIVYEMHMAPEVDDDGNIIYKDDEKGEDKSL